MQRIHRFSKYFLIILMTISAGLGLMRFNSLQLGTSYDDAHYIILAESLSGGQGYQLINFPRPQIERAFPPGWPILLTPLTFLFPGNYTVLKLLSLLLWLASISLIYKLFSRHLESPHLEIVTGLAAANPLLVGTSVTVMSESAYLFFSLLALTFFDSWNSKTEGKKDRLIILIAVIALYSQLIRTIGVSLSFALVVYFLLSRRFREAGLTMGVFMAGMLLQTWINLRNGGSVVSTGYQSQVFNSSVIEKVGQMWANTLGYFNEVLAGTLFPVFSTKVASLLGNYGLQILPLILNAVIILLIIFGAALSCKKIHAMDLYFIVYVLGILAFWNPKVGSVKARFLIPIIPFLYFYLAQGLNWAITKFTRDRISLGTRIAAGAAGIIALTLLARNFQDWRNPVMDQMTDLSVGTSWVSENTPPDAIVMVNEPVPAYVHVRRKTIGYPNAGQDLEKYLNNQGIDYIVVSPKLQSPRNKDLDENIENQVLPILESAPEKFMVVYSNPEYNVTVYLYQGSR
ncbi:MAG: hypothetical protein C4586_02430 [Anaerolineaceae bacterium]|nr:MAG: hypothetical protein C4586_02430 [Anaerolineaceae bacterium]